MKKQKASRRMIGRDCVVSAVLLAVFLSISSVSVLRAQLQEEATAEDTVAPKGNDAAAQSIDQEEPSANMRRATKPTRIRQDQRDQLKSENAMRERVGDTIGRSCEALSDQGEACNFDALKEQALQRLEGAAALYTEEEQHDTQKLVCFDENGEVTNDRDMCAEDQSSFFGLSSDGSADGEDAGFGIPSYEDVSAKMSDRFVGPSSSLGGADLLSIVSEALDRLSGMVTSMQGNPQALAQIQDAMKWLSGILRQYGGGQTPPPGLTEQIMYRLSSISSMTTGGGRAGGMIGQGGGFGGGDVKSMMEMMGKMMPKLQIVIGIFEREGVTVPAESRAVAENALATFNRLREPCESGDMNSCMELANAASGIEANMRPPMERAMMSAVSSGKISFDRIQKIGVEIEAMMSEGMDGMGPPPGMHGGPPQGYGPAQGFGPPSGMMQQGGYGPPSGYEQMMGPGMMPPPGMMPQGYEQMMQQYQGGPPSWER